MAISKPDLTRVWASAAPVGNVIDPDVGSPGKYDAGWISEIPPFQYFNFLQQQFSQGLAVLNEQGIFSWDPITVYPVGAYVKGSDFALYTALVEQAGNDPVGDVINWAIFAGGGGGGLPVLTNNQPLQGTELDGTTVVDILKIDPTDVLQLGNGTNDIVMIPADGSLNIRGTNAGVSTNSGTRYGDSADAASIGGFIGLRNFAPVGDFRIETFAAAGTLSMYVGGAGGEGVNTNRRFELATARSSCWDGDEFNAARPAWQSAFWSDATESSSLRILDSEATLKSAGFNQMNPVNSTALALNIFDKAGVNRYTSSTAVAAATFTVVDPGIAETGQFIMVRNGGSVALTISQGAGVLNWFDGAAAQTGSRTVAVGGIVSIIRREANVFDIMGSGLS